MVTVIAVHNLLEPSTDVDNRLVRAAAQFCFNCVQLCHHAFLRRFPPDDERPIAPALPAVVRKAQERKGLRLPLLGGSCIPFGQMERKATQSDSRLEFSLEGT
jgi:hypothetical protein